MYEFTIYESPDQNIVMFEIMLLFRLFVNFEKWLSQRHEARMAMLSLKVNKTYFVVSLQVNWWSVFYFLRNYVLVMASEVTSKIFLKKAGF